MKIHLVGADLLHAEKKLDGRTDRQSDVANTGS